MKLSDYAKRGRASKELRGTTNKVVRTLNRLRRQGEDREADLIELELFSLAEFMDWLAKQYPLSQEIMADPENIKKIHKYYRFNKHELRDKTKLDLEKILPKNFFDEE